MRLRVFATALLFVIISAICIVSKPGTIQAKPAVQNNEAGLETTAEAAILMEANTGKILWSKQPDKELPMASVTKIMTMLLAVEAVDAGKVKLTDKITTSENAWNMGGSQIYLEPGEELSMEEMLISIAVGSANDACVAVAEHLGGSEEAFVGMMNKKAKELGLAHTNFANTNGLPVENHYTSAHDMAMIIKEALRHPLFVKVSSIYRYDLRGGDFVLWNTNKLLKWYEGTVAGKTGWTNEAKYCLASAVERKGLRLIAVVLGTAEPKSHFRESMKLYNYGFARYQAVNLENQGIKVKTVNVGKGTDRVVDIVTAEKVSLVVPKGQDKGYEKKIMAPDLINAPVQKGDKVGKYIVAKDGKEVLQVDLIANKSIPRASLLQQIYRVAEDVYTLN
ncbi:Serine-type D-Ala-D-Ala carboxypeptidase [Desulfofarcimen acetoxidans DSM 771]|jgi:D-alanyl-D-alanine carboxypeptidase (penicillin-binding protein 5/6)|uniref:serine-type D-Ala-D-Ala carboxypeptidase n=1 Tax=Desulfofarcimen acetoxidans (strain ATCC 49208 / DSM 771 / KCTC 5769 / VKM B-1644 / 5575) TaxID=485916 RepID=C8VYY2_DESAS|nr:D-alanyl-D-alanine carboxypeptidase family protein [Desulfofarcimen acetoxidans]ACV62892.1 Serine-type D-Ala-D-Ala carboxypeptidase [Desulfofarcimen acetoxidans DSM 771]